MVVSFVAEMDIGLETVKTKEEGHQKEDLDRGLLERDQGPLERGLVLLVSQDHQKDLVLQEKLDHHERLVLLAKDHLEHLVSVLNLILQQTTRSKKPHVNVLNPQLVESRSLPHPQKRHDLVQEAQAQSDQEANLKMFNFQHSVKSALQGLQGRSRWMKLGMKAVITTTHSTIHLYLYS